MDPKTALAQLKSAPETFLKNNVLQCRGKVNASSGVIDNYYFGTKERIKDDIIKNFYRITPDAQKDGTYEIFKVHHLRMFPTNDYNGKEGLEFDFQAIEPYELDSRAEVMITPVFSGCTFVYANIAGKVVVAHIEPGKKKPTSLADVKLGSSTKNLKTQYMDPQKNKLNVGTKHEISRPKYSATSLRDQISDKGRFKGHPNHPVTVFGRGGEYLAAGVVIGINNGGQWNIYGQHLTGTGDAGTVISVKKLV